MPRKIHTHVSTYTCEYIHLWKHTPVSAIIESCNVVCDDWIAYTILLFGLKSVQVFRKFALYQVDSTCLHCLIEVGTCRGVGKNVLALQPEKPKKWWAANWRLWFWRLSSEGHVLLNSGKSLHKLGWTMWNQLLIIWTCKHLKTFQNHQYELWRGLVQISLTEYTVLPYLFDQTCFNKLILSFERSRCKLDLGLE